jgi:hypothetical protein
LAAAAAYKTQGKRNENNENSEGLERRFVSMVDMARRLRCVVRDELGGSRHRRQCLMTVDDVDNTTDGEALGTVR